MIKKQSTGTKLNKLLLPDNTGNQFKFKKLKAKNLKKKSFWAATSIIAQRPALHFRHFKHATYELQLTGHKTLDNYRKTQPHKKQLLYFFFAWLLSKKHGVLSKLLWWRSAQLK